MNQYKAEHARRVELHGEEYHHSSENLDQPGEYFRVVGRFNGDWHNDLFEEKKRLSEQAWNETDIIEVGVLKYEDMPPVFQNIVDAFSFNRIISCKVQNQKPGSTVVNHHDDFTSQVNEGERAVRFIVFLEHWSPGQVVVYGNYTFDRWPKGLVVFSDYEKIPHATANVSSEERSVMLITAVASQKTTELIAYGMGIVDV